MTAIDSYAYSSKLAEKDPKAKIFFAFLPLCLCLVLNSPLVSVVTLVVMSGAVIRYSRVSVGKLIGFLLIPAGFLAIGVLPIAVNGYPEGSRVIAGATLGGSVYGFTEESLRTAGSLALRALAAVSCMYFISFTTPMNALFQTLENSPLPRLLTILAELVYRYVFIMAEEAERIKRAQRSRLGYGGFRSYISCAGDMAAGIFIRAYERAGRAYAALESRGGSAEMTFLPEEYAPCGYFYWLALIFSSLLVLVWIFCPPGFC